MPAKSPEAKAQQAAYQRRWYQKPIAGNGTSMYKWLKVTGYPPIMQVLCFNCNNAKRYGKCPHLEDREA